VSFAEKAKKERRGKAVRKKKNDEENREFIACEKFKLSHIDAIF